MKSEPDEFGIDDLAEMPARRASWDGVRNYQARNYLRRMKAGDEAFFYHSSCAQPGIAGRMRVVRDAYPDPSQFDPKQKYFDADSRREAPRWSTVDVKFLERFANPVTLARLRSDPELEGMIVLRRGNRLSVTPVDAVHWRRIVSIAHRES